jgi:5-methyltetrahydropteroyltriglutamate--homocysteine methyltransferase
MKHSTERFLTTHTGSLPRPEDLIRMMYAKEEGVPVEPAALSDRVAAAVAEVVGKQAAAGVDIVNDGEMSKPSYSTYVTGRLTGFELGPTAGRPLFEARDFPEFFARMAGSVSQSIRNPICTSPVSYRDHDAVQRDIANLKAAAAGTTATEVFMTAASPGVIAQFIANEHYPSHEDYVGALADAMKEEYDAIHAAGIVLQVDCPDLASWQVAEAKGHDKTQFRRTIAQNVEALDHATRDIPPEAMRMHLCWGNYAGPHIHDVALREVLPLVYNARPAAISFEAANPRHEHEWEVFKDFPLPDDKVVLPGVIDSLTPFVEHPELVAQRLIRFAELVGRERVIGSTDCGFATFAALTPVMGEIVFAKLGALAEGAALATAKLW